MYSLELYYVVCDLLLECKQYNHRFIQSKVQQSNIIMFITYHKIGKIHSKI